MECTVTAALVISGRVLLAGLLILSGCLKIAQARDAGATIKEVLRVSRRVSGYLVVVISLAELSIGLLLAAGSTMTGGAVRFAAASAAGFFVIVNIPLVILIGRGYSFGCGCFGRSAHRVSKLDVLRNVVLALIAILVIALADSASCASAAIWTVQPLILLAAVVGSVVTALLWAQVENGRLRLRTVVMKFHDPANSGR